MFKKGPPNQHPADAEDLTLCYFLYPVPRNQRQSVDGHAKIMLMTQRRGLAFVIKIQRSVCQARFLYCNKSAPGSIFSSQSKGKNEIFSTLKNTHIETAALLLCSITTSHCDAVFLLMPHLRPFLHSYNQPSSIKSRKQDRRFFLLWLQLCFVFKKEKQKTGNFDNQEKTLLQINDMFTSIFFPQHKSTQISFLLLIDKCGPYLREWHVALRIS